MKVRATLTDASGHQTVVHEIVPGSMVCDHPVGAGPYRLSYAGMVIDFDSTLTWQDSVARFTGDPDARLS